MKNKKLFLLDMDGTIYLGDRLFDATIPFLNRIKDKGGRYVFLTNNSSKSTQTYIDKLKKLGIETAVEDFLTSTDATCIYINNNYRGKKFYCMGTKSFISQLQANGVDVTTEIEDDIFGVLISNDTEITFKKLDDVSRLLTERNLVYIATNPDWTCPTEYGFVPDCGSFAEMLFRATKKSPIFIGKPKPEMVYLAMEKFGFDKSQTVVIGDRIYTDVAAGINAGVDAVLVLSGETKFDEIGNSDIKPTYVFDSIKDINNLI